MTDPKSPPYPLKPSEPAPPEPISDQPPIPPGDSNPGKSPKPD